jgi:hypothetical protein
MAGRQCFVRENRAPEAGHRVGVVRVGQALDQPDRVNQEGADDRRIQALVVEHQHRFIESGAESMTKPPGLASGAFSPD